jgi:hypothetical protein
VVSLNDASVNLAKSADGKSVDLSVKQGRAEVADGAGRTVVNENQKADLAKKQMEVQKVSIVPAAPGYNARLPFGKPVAFSWRVSGNADVVLEVSANASFAALEASRGTSGGGATVTLGPGTWYWRVVPVGDRSQASAPSRFSIGDDEPLFGLSPGDNQVFHYRDRPPLVGFRWSESRSAASYQLEVSRESGMGSPRRVRSQTTGVSLDGLEDGVWYWRVAPFHSFSTEGGSPSPVRSFRIEKKAELDPPRPLAPASGERLSSLSGEPVFSWRGGDYTRYEVEVSGLGVNEVAGSFFRAPRSFASGDYQWRVRGITSDGTRSQYSENIPFTVSAAESVRALAPAAGATFAVGESVPFSWNDPNRGKNYQLEVSRNAGFSGLVIDETTSARSLARSGLGEGEYYWRVGLLDEQGKRLAVSDALRFSVLGAPAAPQALSPAAGETVEARDRIVFRWQPVAGADQYRILFRENGGRTVFDRTVGGSEYVFAGVKELESGGFAWEIRALRGGKAGDVTRTSFTLKAATITEKPVIITPSTIYID